MSRFACALLLAASAAAPAAAQGFSRTLEGGIETAEVYRGEQSAELNVQAKAGVDLGPVYASGHLIAPIGDDTDELLNEARITAGFAPDLALGLAEVDVGARAYLYLDDSAVLADDDRLEAYVGLNLRLPLSPSAYVNYDFERDQLVFEGAVAQSIGLGGLRAFDLSASAGYVDPSEGDAYGFLEGRADFVQGFGFGVEGYVGARVAVASEDVVFEELTAAGPVFGQDAEAWAGAGLRSRF